MTLAVTLSLYGVLSLIVSIVTVSRWKRTEELEMSTPVGDMEYFDYDYGYSFANFMFLPSIILCELYKVVCSAFQ